MRGIAVRLTLIVGLFFAIAAEPALASGYSVLYNFGSSKTGATPYSQLLNVNGVYYGTTQRGGAYGYGTVYKLIPGKPPQFIHSFGEGKDGAGPYGPLIAVNGELFGTTARGGKYNQGTLFRVSPTGLEVVLYHFGSVTHGGALPTGGVTELNGFLYGTTSGGGKYGFGTLFKSSQNGVTEFPYSFDGNSGGCVTPTGALTLAGGLFYGTTQYGGKYSWGCLFKATSSGVVSPLYQFGAFAGDGQTPLSGVIAVGGSLVGGLSGGGNYGAGALYSVNTSGTETLLYSFLNGLGDAEAPWGPPIDVAGTLYGTTNSGGLNNKGLGAVYAYKPGATADTVLHSFLGTKKDGETPAVALTPVGSVLYGTTPSGGAYGWGVLFEVSP